MVQRAESKRQWISGLAITLTSLVCLFAFWHLSPGVTYTVAVCALVALIVLFWVHGGDR
ncbi:VIT1/CCC1 family predicted Fe2+/Mn2+ transporter [Bradyrhizobium elkanii]|uniref:VIT1/CCC1 family predicted Fe2+/Mn2+ transporter n=1 Tax=Bradyrhizobium elkanii TaxID=29448 RepID=A0ABV4F810_BRAEL|nr:VIT1/CCC1 family predicted Fe2+/Mn2+ transporter [Bradyrhizobium elkanii]MCP1976955.1 VIT1/CCC1 family predicted Fe2+/Mn2+ transporter [Bradyrhizobium elkanii]MCS3888527.1 VIT1/CCC1 family predicted Fe2+/Mn2+ transporter [Bradyrhizobium elkanii]MCS4212451.1 VIT1/CCC1 family predicted Fe2+/Mn2+ transporter [Bradyrhizobium elkanii]MCW2191914.1 VIT1/CCC1 family predicted Fe2+/Mn2+ transporter [Bradyrhizobium elkanii]